MDIIVFEPLIGGHHETLLRQYIKILCRSGVVVHLLCSKEKMIGNDSELDDARRNRKLHFHLIPEAWDEKSGIHRMVRFAGIVIGDYHYACLIKRYIKSLQERNEGGGIAFLFMYLGVKPHMPGWLWKWVLPVPWAALGGESWRAPLKWRQKRIGKLWDRMGTAAFRVENCRKIFCWKGSAHRFLADHADPRKLEVVTDSTNLDLPSETPLWLQPYLTLWGDRFVVGLAGGVLPRKGVRAFLDAAAQLKDLPVVFVIAGQIFWEAFDSGTKSHLRAGVDGALDPASQLCVIDQRFERESDFNWLVRHFGLCYLAYTGFDGSSNVMTKAAAFGVPVMVSQDTVMSELCDEFDLGWIVPAGDAAAVAGAIRDVVTHKSGARNDAGFKRFTRLHSDEHLAEQLRDMLKELA